MSDPASPRQPPACAALQLRPSRRQQLAAAVASMLLTGGTCAALLHGMASRSPDRWLAPNTEVLEMVAACDGLPQPQQRARCKQTAVAARLSTDAPVVHVGRR